MRGLSSWIIPWITAPTLVFTFFKSTTYDETLDSWWDTPIWREEKEEFTAAMSNTSTGKLNRRRSYTPAAGYRRPGLTLSSNRLEPCQNNGRAPSQTPAVSLWHRWRHRSHLGWREDTWQDMGWSEFRSQRSKVTWDHVNKPYLTADVSPSNVPIIVNFSRSQSLMLLRQQNTILIHWYILIHCE